MTGRLFLATVLAIVLTSACVAAQDGLALMKVEAGARQVGMGGAYVSLTDDPNATYYNPAAAAGTRKFTASFGHNDYWENIRLETGYFTSNLTNRTFLHGGIRYATVENLESRLIPSAEPDALFSAYDVSFKGGVAYQVNQQMALGVAMGWYIEKIDIYRGSAFNVDLGALYLLSNGINLGASVTNLGSTLSLALSGQEGTRDISLPTTYRLGGSYRYDRYLGAVDAVVVDDEFHLHVGVEAALHESLSLRAGYMINYDTKNFTAGASFSRRKVTIDYAFVPYTNDLGTSHLFNLTFSL
ncbi:MAG: PorV/PorQ family protein [candidate division Zixibacteria bacterium]|nr:PorV/PorQ family protein [candidate division Zixibacteria bacterium]